MKYFGQFKPVISYGDSETDVKQISDIYTNRFNMENIPLKKEHIYKRYRIEGDTKPEILAKQLYGDFTYNWVILMLNGMTDPFLDFPMTTRELYDYVKRKYGQDNIYSHHHYHDTKRDVPLDEIRVKNYLNLLEDKKKDPKVEIPIEIVAINNFDYEDDLNNKKRDIVIVNPRYIDVFIREFKNAS